MKCKKSLYKSTYKGNAFTKGNEYEVVREEKRFVWLIDNTGKEFSMCKENQYGYYFIKKYFKTK